MPKLLDRETVDRLYGEAVDVLADVGVAFDLAGARDRFRKSGARVEGKRVYVTPGFLEDHLSLIPKYSPGVAASRRLVAASPFSNAPMIIDDVTGRVRRGTVNDAVKLYQLTETSDLYRSASPGVADPEDNDSGDAYIGQIAMLLKYSDKRPDLAVCATKSNTRNGDVYTSAKKAVQLIREIKGDDKNPVMGQGICPMAPLSYDEDALLNLAVLAEEGQDITICPCTLSFMTGPESLTGIVVHDLAIALAGAVYVQLLKPGAPVGFSNFSTMTDMKTMQPAYGCPEYLNVQIMFYEVCRHLDLACGLFGCFSDAGTTDYQSGFESCLTAMLPFSMTDVDEIGCYPGHMAAFAGGSFNKVIFDEELITACNRSLQGLDLSVDPLLKDKLGRAVESKSFLTIGDVGIYRKEQRVANIFDKSGIPSDSSASKEETGLRAAREIEQRCRAYELPDRSKTQKDLLSKYLPHQCRY